MSLTTPLTWFPWCFFHMAMWRLHIFDSTPRPLLLSSISELCLTCFEVECMIMHVDIDYPFNLDLHECLPQVPRLKLQPWCRLALLMPLLNIPWEWRLPPFQHPTKCQFRFQDRKYQFFWSHQQWVLEGSGGTPEQNRKPTNLELWNCSLPQISAWNQVI